ncbi:Rieske 2Fe-2S domain-containing protein [filamentous cyanobacterium LEGE 11480]|uniref:Rieske 2Fe-2S domain-containing protein n=1 Tax=Romeriopsis navalis LEGE 11480 TaxID=2777977 RepID=A0A928Z5B2_9CYAN|nr:Rieske 2Fe-2S domain-containing protein [Romeriopsis navalis]MBE9032644.1 Rieske 2Fe-2S domain-containing protein [Romeriopsis navalis LEGE 11480]
MVMNLEQAIAGGNGKVERFPGGADIERFEVLEAWYPVFYLRDLDQTKPQRFTLLDLDLVIWWEPTSQTWRAMTDRCPHRLAPLSEGRITADGHLECPYHGWTFAGTGECQTIPQQTANDAAETSQRACIRSFPTAERQGMLFVFPGQADNAATTPVPIIGPLETDPDGWTLFDTFRDLPYDALTLLENVLDPSHLPFTHHNSVGKRENAAPMDLQIVESGKQGFRGTWPEGPRKGNLGKQDTVFVAPNLMWHELTSKQFGRTLTVVYATPTRKGECRLFARFPFQFSSKIPALAISLMPRWYSHLNQNMILEDDQIFLHYQERYLAKQGGSDNISKAFYMPTKADRFVFEFRQWVSLYQADPFPGQVLPPAQSRTQLLDRYHSHTKNCASCRKANVRISQIQIALGTIAVLALAVSPVLTIVTSQMGLPLLPLAIGNAMITIIASLGWWSLGQFKRGFTQGRMVPPRNIAEKGAKAN